MTTSNTPDVFIVVAPQSNTFITGVNQYDMVFATTSNTQSFTFGYSNTYLRINSNGYVGIGLSNPIAPLQVAGSIFPALDNVSDLGGSNMRYRTLYLNGGTLSTNSLGSLQLADSNGNAASLFLNKVLIGGTSNLVSLQLDSNNNLQYVNATISNGILLLSSNGSNIGSGTSGWSNSGSNVFMIGSNVGIGTSNPQASLHVTSNMRIDGALSMYNQIQFGGFEVIPGNSNTNISQIIQQIPLVPGYCNMVYGTSGSNGTIISIMSNTSNDSFRFVSGAASNEIMRLVGNGLLGIGNSNPKFPLDVNGDINFSGILRQSGIAYVSSQWSNAGPTIFAIGSNVAIGKSNATFPLDVQGDINFSGGLFKGGSAYIGSQFSNNSSNIFLTGSNVGLGISNPQAQLHLSSNLRVDGNLTMQSYMQFGGLYVTPGMGVSNAGQVILVSSNLQGYSNLSSNGIQFSINGNTASNIFQFIAGNASNEVYRINALGYHGIGTSNPANLLSVAGAISIGAAYSNVVAPTNGLIVQGALGVGTSNPGSLLAVAGGVTIGTAYSNVITPSNSLLVQGNVGIGTSNPAFTLDVVGNINCSGYISGNINANNISIFKNKIINGDMRINQRNSNNSSYSYVYNIDRFTCLTSGAAAYTITQSNTSFSASQTFTKGYNIAVNAAFAGAFALTDHYMPMLQRIEGYNIGELGWGTASAQPVSLSFWMNTSLSTTYYLSLRNGPTGSVYPPAAFTGTANPSTGVWTGTVSGQSYGNGSYKLSDSTEFGSGQNALNGFTTAGYWTSSSNYTTAVVGGFLYAGIVTTPVNAASVSGEWLQIQLPTAITLSSYSMTNIFGSSGKMPTAWTIAGSFDGLVWSTIDVRSGVAWSGGQSQTFMTTNFKAQYSYYKCIVQIIGSSGSTTFNMSYTGYTSYSYVAPIVPTAINAWAQYSVSIPGPTTGAWDTSTNIGIELSFATTSHPQYNAPTGNAWNSGSYCTLSGTSTTFNASTANSVTITGLQLEKGSSSTLFEFRPYPVELQLCQRYYEPIINTLYSTAIGQSYGTGGLNVCNVNFCFKTVKRTIPTLDKGSVKAYNNCTDNVPLVTPEILGYNVTISSTGQYFSVLNAPLCYTAEL